MAESPIPAETATAEVERLAAPIEADDFDRFEAIRKLIDAGQVDAAKQALHQWQRLNPDQSLPIDLADWLDRYQ